MDRDYQEIITYSFVDPDLQKLLDPATRPLALANPIAANMSVMRTSLWPGLLQTLLYNQNRQAERQRLFEVGRRFLSAAGHISQDCMIAGVITGPTGTPQWGMERREVDFLTPRPMSRRCWRSPAKPGNIASNRQTSPPCIRVWRLKYYSKGTT